MLNTSLLTFLFSWNMFIFFEAPLILLLDLPCHSTKTPRRHDRCKGNRSVQNRISEGSAQKKLAWHSGRRATATVVHYLLIYLTLFGCHSPSLRYEPSSCAGYSIPFSYIGRSVLEGFPQFGSVLAKRNVTDTFICLFLF